MATYIFENISQTDASNFAAGDRLIFTSSTVAALGVTDVAGSSVTTGLGTTTTQEGITLSENGHSLTFSASALNSSENTNNVIFANGDALVTGTSGADTTLNGGMTQFTSGHGAVFFGFAGNDVFNLAAANGNNGIPSNDTVNGGDGNDTIVGSSSHTDASGNFTESDYYLGGAGNDSIVGGVGNDHIYGNLFTSTQGTVDGDDSLAGGAGNDYIQGNAGNDSIDGGVGNDHLYGGADNDLITGGDGYDYLQGNKGNDTLDGGALNDELHGGQGDDSLVGGTGNDMLFGEVGNDTIVGGAGYDSLSGGSGNDVFNFAVGDASNANVSTIPAGGTTPAGHDLTDVITDFASGQDHLHLPFVPATVLGQQAGVTFSSVDAAQVYAQQVLDAHTGTNEVAHIVVGGDSYLFYNDTGADNTTINEVIKLQGDTTLLTTTDFV